jgi:DNA-binding MarR family transcriptional regulator
LSVESFSFAIVHFGTNGVGMDARSVNSDLRDRLHLLLEASAATRAWRARLAEQVAAWGLTDQEFLVLWLCDDRSGAAQGQGELAATLGASAAQMSGLVERLRQRDLLQVERVGNDRRRQAWRLSPTGKEILVAACQALVAGSGQLSGWLSPKEVTHLKTLIQRWLPDSAGGDARSSTPDQGGPSSCAA